MRNGNVLCFLLYALFLSLIVSGCGGNSAKTKSQVVARVNDVEITVHQLNQALGMGLAAPANPAEARKNALENIINQTLGEQAALKMKLDQDPAVMLAIESAKRRVLADAYFERGLQKTAAPKSSAQHAYYVEHPELFGNRRIYIFNQLAVKAGKESLAALQAKAADVKHMGEFVIWLKNRAVDFDLAAEVKPSEQIPAAVLAELQKLKAGEAGYVIATDGVLMIEMLQIIEQPLTEQQARPLIERFLVNQEKIEVAQKMFQDLRTNGNVEYLGDFKPGAKSEQSAQPQAAVPTSKSTSTRPAPVTPGAEYMETGLRGL